MCQDDDNVQDEVVACKKENNTLRNLELPIGSTEKHLPVEVANCSCKLVFKFNSTLACCSISTQCYSV